MKTKALISFAVTAKLICAFVFAYADCWFSHGAAQLCSYISLSPLMQYVKNLNPAICPIKIEIMKRNTCGHENMLVCSPNSHEWYTFCTKIKYDGKINIHKKHSKNKC